MKAYNNDRPNDRRMPVGLREVLLKTRNPGPTPSLTFSLVLVPRNTLLQG